MRQQVNIRNVNINNKIGHSTRKKRTHLRLLLAEVVKINFAAFRAFIRASDLASGL